MAPDLWDTSAHSFETKSEFCPSPFVQCWTRLKEKTKKHYELAGFDARKLAGSSDATGDR